MTNVLPPMCFHCKRLKGTDPWACEAYPKGIPQEILYYKVDHRKPYTGDHGLRYKGEDRPIYDVMFKNEK